MAKKTSKSTRDSILPSSPGMTKKVVKNTTPEKLVAAKKNEEVRVYGSMCIDPKSGKAHFESSDYKDGKEIITRVPMGSNTPTKK